MASRSAEVAPGLLLGLVLAYGAARFSNVLFAELRDTVFGRVTERAMRRIGLQVFRHVHALDLEFHLNRRTGALARDIERGTTGISFLMRFFVFNIAPTLLEIAMVVGIFLLQLQRQLRPDHAGHRCSPTACSRCGPPNGAPSSCGK